MSDESGSEEEDIETIRRKALKAIQGEIEGSDSDEDNSEEEYDDESENSDDDEIDLDFNDKNKSQIKQKKETDKGIMGLKFMKRGEERLKE